MSDDPVVCLAQLIASVTEAMHTKAPIEINLDLLEDVQDLSFLDLVEVHNAVVGDDPTAAEPVLAVILNDLTAQLTHYTRERNGGAEDKRDTTAVTATTTASAKPSFIDVLEEEELSRAMQASLDEGHDSRHSAGEGGWSDEDGEELSLEQLGLISRQSTHLAARTRLKPHETLTQPALRVEDVFEPSETLKCAALSALESILAPPDLRARPVKPKVPEPVVRYRDSKVVEVVEVQRSGGRSFTYEMTRREAELVSLRRSYRPGPVPHAKVPSKLRSTTAQATMTGSSGVGSAGTTREKSNIRS